MVALVGTLALVGNPYTASGGKPAAPAVPRVLDATDKLVGQVVGTDPKSLNPNVILNISGPPIIVQVAPDSFPNYHALLFTSANCSGQPYFDAFSTINMPHMFPIVGVMNNILYRVLASSTPVPITYASYWYVAQGICINSGGFDDAAVIGDPIIDLSTQFTPPYRFVYP
jgi:hypothetical protein